jgi:hypothetical protein
VTVRLLHDIQSVDERTVLNWQEQAAESLRQHAIALHRRTAHDDAGDAEASDRPPARLTPAGTSGDSVALSRVSMLYSQMAGSCRDSQLGLGRE